MGAPPVTDASQDLTWCEGAIDHLGVSEALRAWRPLLRPGGTVAFTEPVWLVDSPPLPASAWWKEYDEPMQDRIGDLRKRLPDDPSAREVVAAAEAEIGHFRRFSDCYSYEFFIVQPTG